MSSNLWAHLDALPPVYTGPEMKAAVLVPFYEDGASLRVIMTRRPDTMRSHPGDVVFPGGMIEPGDDGPVDTAVREAWEEVGLPPEDVEVLGGLDPVHTRSVTMRISPVVARVQRPVELVPEPGEVAAIIEPTIDQLLIDGDWRTAEWGGRTMWFYEFPEGVLWGATAFIVRGLLDYFR
ncbi:MAG TPA: CoA pyrophosphatase [Acidimicrobiia bacterium]|nr:CoA pyrophosphatase [Acidimicrobiia bacterium]